LPVNANFDEKPELKDLPPEFRGSGLIKEKHA